MPISTQNINSAIDLAKNYGAKKLLLFGSALDNPSLANDLDLGIDGVDGFRIFEFAEELERIINIRVDITPLDEESKFVKSIYKYGKIIYEQGKAS